MHDEERFFYVLRPVLLCVQHLCVLNVSGFAFQQKNRINSSFHCSHYFASGVLPVGHPFPSVISVPLILIFVSHGCSSWTDHILIAVVEFLRVSSFFGLLKVEAAFLHLWPHFFGSKAFSPALVCYSFMLR